MGLLSEILPPRRNMTPKFRVQDDRSRHIHARSKHGWFNMIYPRVPYLSCRTHETGPGAEAAASCPALFPPISRRRYGCARAIAVNSRFGCPRSGAFPCADPTTTPTQQNRTNLARTKMATDNAGSGWELGAGCWTLSLSLSHCTVAVLSGCIVASQKVKTNVCQP